MTRLQSSQAYDDMKLFEPLGIPKIGDPYSPRLVDYPPMPPSPKEPSKAPKDETLEEAPSNDQNMTYGGAWF
jgi:hypothetical protein